MGWVPDFGCTMKQSLGITSFTHIMAAHGKSVSESPLSSTKKSSSTSKSRLPKKSKTHICPICLDEINDDTQGFIFCKETVNHGFTAAVAVYLSLV